MGQAISLIGIQSDRMRQRRRLQDDDMSLEEMTEWFETAAVEARIRKREKYEFKPFGGHNYYYTFDVTYNPVILEIANKYNLDPEKMGLYAGRLNLATWAFFTAGGLAVDWREALVVLAAGIGLQEADFKYNIFDRWGYGSSYCWNVSGGYVGYHYFVKRNKRWLPFLAAWFTAFADLKPVFDEYVLKAGLHVSHYAHFLGYVHGFLMALALDKWGPFKKKRPLF